MTALLGLKKNLSKEYDMKDMGDMKTIIGSQVINNLGTKTLRI